MSAEEPQSQPDRYSKVFQSSNLHHASYDPTSQTLSIWFGNGSQYDYAFVPEQVWFKLATAVSPGQYLHQFIKPSYRAKRI